MTSHVLSVGMLHTVCPRGPGQATCAWANLSPRTQLLKSFPILLDHRLCHGPMLLLRGDPSSKLSQECWSCVTKQWKAALSPDIKARNHTMVHCGVLKLGQ